MRDHVGVEISEIRAAFDDVFDQAIVFHGFADYMRDYDVFVYVTAGPGTVPRHLRYRFKHCVRAIATTAVPAEVWKRSLDERLVDFDQGRDVDGYLWGVRWQVLYPGMTLVPDSADAGRWSQILGIPFYEAMIETNGHNLSLIFFRPVGRHYDGRAHAVPRGRPWTGPGDSPHVGHPLPDSLGDRNDRWLGLARVWRYRRRSRSQSAWIAVPAVRLAHQCRSSSRCVRIVSASRRVVVMISSASWRASARCRVACSSWIRTAGQACCPSSWRSPPAGVRVRS